MPPDLRRATTEPRSLQWLMIGVALAFLGLLLVVPLAVVFAGALANGVPAYFSGVRDADTLAAVRLTLLTVLIVVPLNVCVGILGAWAIAKFQFAGKRLLVTLLDLPFAVSPVVAGLIFVLLLGPRGPLGGFLAAHGVKVIFAAPGIIIATLFVTFPFVVRQLIPLMESQGTDEEEAALVLGARGWQTFWRVTLPNIKWGLLYGAILATARALGEFGAVSVVSGHVRGQTVTMPLQVEILYNEYRSADAFAVASILTLLALVSLAVKSVVEWRAAAAADPELAAREGPV